MPAGTIKAALDEEKQSMKAGIHPNNKPTTIRCACGAVIECLYLCPRMSSIQN